MGYKFKLWTYWKWYINYGIILVILGYTNNSGGNKRKGEERKQIYKVRALKVTYKSNICLRIWCQNIKWEILSWIVFVFSVDIKLIYFILILAQILYFVWEINEVIHPMKANMGKTDVEMCSIGNRAHEKFFDTSSPKHSLVHNILVYKTHFLFVRGPTISLAHICMRGLLLDVHFRFLSLHLPHSSSSINW